MTSPVGLRNRAFAEFLGTGFLVAVVVGSGIAAERLSPNDLGLQLLENAAATGAGLAALILAIGPVSGAHLNPVVTLAHRVLGNLATPDALCYVGAQLAGGASGAVIGNLMFSEPAFDLSTKVRSGGGLWLAEVVATLGLLLVVFGVARSGQTLNGAFAVGAYVRAAYFFTSSTSFANPAVTLARTLTDTFAGIEPASAAPFIAFQLLGAALALVVGRFLYLSDPVLAADVAVARPDEPTSDHATAAKEQAHA
jgi:arsenate reductase